jgi:hypothetical protein
MLDRIAQALCLPKNVSEERILAEIGYWSRLIYRFSMPGLVEQAPAKYKLDRVHVQEMPR